MPDTSPPPPPRHEPPPTRPLVVYDGDCAFCRLCVDRWRASTGNAVDYAPAADAAARLPDIPAGRFAQAVQFVGPDGAARSGAEAVFHVLAHARNGGIALWAYRRVPGFARVAEWAYARIARNRPLISRLVRCFWGPSPGSPTYTIARWAFLRFLGLTYFIAFASLGSQVAGLIGSRGVAPAAEFLPRAREVLGGAAPWKIPTLCWLDAGDGTLQLLCGAGAALGLALAAGISTTPVLVLLWMMYLSLLSVSNVFLGFQWDVLLLESGFLAIFLAPPRLVPAPSRREPPPSRTVVGLLMWLLFRLMFASGLVKLLSGDPVWWNATALQYHYETQPLPTWTSWHAHHLPAGFQKLSCVVMFVIEIAVPFLLFAPRRPRIAACALLIGLQVLIVATGNYCFFNLLTIALCIVPLDDASWPRWLRSRLLPTEGRTPAGGRPSAAPRTRGRGWPRWITVPLAALLLPLSAVTLFQRLGLVREWPAAVAGAADALGPYHLANAYGLFADMTTERLEIVVEGSRDGREWTPYEFRYKPGDPPRRPEFVAPHQPRLDWQMWFAALGQARQNPWFIGLCRRLLEGSPDVLALLEKNPFPDGPPRYVRGVVYRYRFTDPETRRRTGRWWERTAVDFYTPPLSLQ